MRAAGGIETADAEVTVNSADVAGVVLQMSKGATARGRVTFDTAAAPPDLQPAQVIVTSSSADDLAPVGMDAPPRPKEDWTFELAGLRGRAFIRAGTLTSWQLRSVHLNGMDVTDVPIDFRNGDVNGLEVTLTQRMTELSGRVTDVRGNTVIDATIVVFADDREKWGPQSRFIGTARPDQQGRFSIRGLPPARYRAAALDYVESGEERNPDLLDEWRSRAIEVTLAEGETRTISLTLSP